MKKFEVELWLEHLKEARDKKRLAVLEFDEGYNAVLKRLLYSAAAVFMSDRDVAKHLGTTPAKVRSLMRTAGMNPRDGKRLLSAKAAEALATNAELLGIEPGEMDLMSPLAYLPMGKELKQKLQDERTAGVTLPEESVSGNPHPDEDESTPHPARHCRCKWPISSGTLSRGAEVCMWCSYILVDAQ